MLSSTSSHINKNKLEKYWWKLMKSFHLTNEISLEQAEQAIRKYDKEIFNPLQVKTKKHKKIFMKIISN